MGIKTLHLYFCGIQLKESENVRRKTEKIQNNLGKEGQGIFMKRN